MESREKNEESKKQQEIIRKRNEKITLIYRRYQKLMFWTACDVLHDDYLAEDVVQEAFVKIFHNVERIGDVNASETKRYVYIATKHMAIDCYRKRTLDSQRELFAEDVDRLHEMEAEPCLIEPGENRIMEILDALPDTYKEVCLLKYLQKMENKEIAQQLNMREGTVRQKLLRGKLLVEQAIRKLEETEGEKILWDEETES